jgi:hypothetical protein
VRLVKWLKVLMVLALAVIPFPVAQLLDKPLLRRKRAVAERVLPRE